MPEISRFHGIVIRMFAESGVSHHLPHFHAYYQSKASVFSLEEISVMAGDLPHRQERMVLEWAELHGEELLRDWELLQGGSAPLPIEPLR